MNNISSDGFNLNYNTVDDALWSVDESCKYEILIL